VRVTRAPRWVTHATSPHHSGFSAHVRPAIAATDRASKLAGNTYRVYRDDGTGNFTLIATKRTTSFRDVPETLGAVSQQASPESYSGADPLIGATYSYYVVAYSKLGSQMATSNVATILVAAPSLKKH